MAANDYTEKLKDPRWQRRRLEVLARDGWSCTNCSDNTKTLHVHHRWYSGDPWEAPDEALHTLCEDCHKNEGNRSRQERRMLEAMRQLSFSTAQFEILADAFESAVAFPPTSSGALPDHGQAMTLACALAELVEDRERFLSFGRDYFTRSRKKVS